MAEFTGLWVPAALLKDDRLSLPEKVVLAYMLSFEEFFASDGHIAAQVGMNRRTVERIICTLRTKGFVVGARGTRKPKYSPPATTQKCVIDKAPCTHPCVVGVRKNEYIDKRVEKRTEEIKVQKEDDDSWEFFDDLPSLHSASSLHQQNPQKERPSNPSDERQAMNQIRSLLNLK